MSLLVYKGNGVENLHKFNTVTKNHSEIVDDSLMNCSIIAEDDNDKFVIHQNYFVVRPN